MALEFIDGFDHVSGNSLGSGLYPYQTKWDSTSGLAMQPYSSPVHYPALSGCVSWSFGLGDFSGFGGVLTLKAAGRNILTSVQTRVVGFAVYHGGLFGSYLPQFFDGATEQVRIEFDTSTHKLKAISNGVTLGTTTNTMSTGQWYYVEVKVKISSSVGTVEVRVTSGGARTTWLNLTGVNTQVTGNATTNGIALEGGGQYVDDFYCLNTTGGLNDFLGEQRIITSLASADGASAVWTPDTGTALYSRVNEAAANGDTSYIKSATPGDKAVFTHPSITPGGAVKAVQLGAFHRKDDTGARTWCPEILDYAAAYHDGTAVSPSSGYTWASQIYESDPATSAAWTLAHLNASQFGAKLVS